MYTVFIAECAPFLCVAAEACQLIRRIEGRFVGKLNAHFPQD